MEQRRQHRALRFPRPVLRSRDPSPAPGLARVLQPNANRMPNPRGEAVIHGSHGRSHGWIGQSRTPGACHLDIRLQRCNQPVPIRCLQPWRQLSPTTLHATPARTMIVELRGCRPLRTRVAPHSDPTALCCRPAAAAPTPARTARRRWRTTSSRNSTSRRSRSARRAPAGRARPRGHGRRCSRSGRRCGHQ